MACVAIFQMFMKWDRYSTQHNNIWITECLAFILGACDWALSLRNSPVFHSAGAVNPLGKLSNCRQLLSESDQPNALNDDRKIISYDTLEQAI